MVIFALFPCEILKKLAGMQRCTVHVETSKGAHAKDKKEWNRH